MRMKRLTGKAVLMLTLLMTSCIGSGTPRLSANDLCLVLSPLDLSPAEFHALSMESSKRALKYECWYAVHCEKLNPSGCGRE